ncbi:hypothetical protein EVAR_90009_1 [Eumeta japonica]|uniref:Uncharacterized protein n=1 Tax=Eumeta variegata TaxID=151549 RepID=A0A4C2ABU5_EUMVA|nr:hypothetical protein EVAR_90009_1 [Eumeta japonica]
MTRCGPEGDVRKWRVARFDNLHDSLLAPQLKTFALGMGLSVVLKSQRSHLSFAPTYRPVLIAVQSDRFVRVPNPAWECSGDAGDAYRHQHEIQCARRRESTAPPPPNRVRNETMKVVVSATTANDLPRYTSHVSQCQTRVKLNRVPRRPNARAPFYRNDDIARPDTRPRAGRSAEGRSAGLIPPARTTSAHASFDPAPAASASLPNPTRPGPQSQSLFRSYGSNLPTSLPTLFYRPEALHLGDLLRYGYEPARHLRVRPSPEFSRIPWNSNAQAEKKTLPGPLGGVFRPLWVTLSNSRLSRRGNDYRNDLSLSLGSTDSRATTVHAKPFSTSVLQGLAGVFATTTKICTDGGPGGLTPRPFCALRRARPTRYGLMTARFKRAVARAGNAPVLLTKIGPLGTVIRSRGFIVRSFAPIPSSDDRFARQNRYGPPPEFPDFDLTRHSSPSFGSQHLCSERALIRGLGTGRLRGDADRDPRPSSRAFQKIETPLHFRYAFQFDRYTRGDSTTRTHARLLGPCYKTGPASARNRIIADGYAHGQRLHGGIDGAQRRGPHSGGTSNATTPRVGPDAPKRVRVSYSYRPIGRPVGHRRGPTTELRSPGSRTALRPTSNGSRCLTEREVHAVPGDDTHDPRPPTRPRKTEIDGRPGRPYARSTETNVESLRESLAAALRLYGPGTLYGKAAPFKTNLDRRPDDEKAEPPEHHMSRDRYDRAIRRWALSCSLAATKEILTRYPSARRRARFDVESAYGGYIVTKISRSCAAHIAPVVSSIRRFDYDTELPYVESDLCRDANTKTTRATFVCAAA